jgi:hypothetical protein
MGTHDAGRRVLVLRRAGLFEKPSAAGLQQCLVGETGSIRPKAAKELRSRPSRLIST